MTDYTSLTCPRCGGRLCVDVQYPDRLYCDTCEDPDEPDEEDQRIQTCYEIMRPGVREAAMRHDVLAGRRYVKPFKWFKFNRARKATSK